MVNPYEQNRFIKYQTYSKTIRQHVKNVVRENPIQYMYKQEGNYAHRVY